MKNMSLRDEIEKLIQSEQRLLVQRGQEDADHLKRQLERFQPLLSLIKEVVASLDSNHVEFSVFLDSVKLRLGERKGDCFSMDVQWEVQPDHGYSLAPAKGKSPYSERPGFRVEEDYWTPFENHFGKRTVRFDTEQETAEYLIQRIAEVMAYYRHREGKDGG